VAQDIRRRGERRRDTNRGDGLTGTVL